MSFIKETRQTLLPYSLYWTHILHLNKKPDFRHFFLFCSLTLHYPKYNNIKVNDNSSYYTVEKNCMLTKALSEPHCRSPLEEGIANVYIKFLILNIHGSFLTSFLSKRVSLVRPKLFKHSHS